MTTFAPALHLQNDNIHTKIKAQMIIKDPGSSITHFIGMLCAIAGLFPLILKAASYGTTVSVVSMGLFFVTRCKVTNSKLIDKMFVEKSALKNTNSQYP